MTEEIINSDGSRNWQANILLDNNKRLEQENKDFETLAKSLYKRIEELEKENEALAFRERLYKADYEASKQENKELKEKITSLESEIRQKKMTIMMNNDHYLTVDENNRKYRSALEEILESAKFAQCLPCGSGNLEDCLNCDDDTTNNGQFCMEKRIHEIKTKCVEVLSINS